MAMPHADVHARAAAGRAPGYRAGVCFFRARCKQRAETCPKSNERPLDPALPEKRVKPKCQPRTKGLLN
eukprot:5248593-Prymnesium_polylepis.1